MGSPIPHSMTFLPPHPLLTQPHEPGWSDSSNDEDMEKEENKSNRDKDSDKMDQEEQDEDIQDAPICIKMVWIRGSS